MAQVSTFKKSIWRKIDDKSEELKTEWHIRKARIKAALSKPETIEKIKTAAKVSAGIIIFALEVRKELRPTLADIERRQKLYSFYDPHTHIRFNTKRKVRPEVANEILERASMGERVYDILREKHLV